VVPQEFGQGAEVIWREVLDDDEGHAALGRDMAEEFLKGFEPASRAPDTDDRETACRRWFRRIR
jgi:hypothetical protein